MSLAIGIVVDDAIMVLENITRHFHMGKSAKQAALDGAREITFAATASTIAVIAVFIPVLAGHRLRRRVPLPVRHDHLHRRRLSLLEAITLTPMRCSQFMTAKEDESRFAQVRQPRLLRTSPASTARTSWNSEPAASLEDRWSGSRSPLFVAFAPSRFLWIKKEFLPAQDIGVFLIQFRKRRWARRSRSPASRRTAA